MLAGGFYDKEVIMMLAKADRHEKRKKRIAARPHKYISYLGSVNKFEVKYPIGKDDKGKPLYFQPIKRFDELEGALARKDDIERAVFGRLLRDKTITMADLFANIINKNVLRAKSTVQGFQHVTKAFQQSMNVSVVELWTKEDIKKLNCENVGEAFNSLIKEKKWEKSTAETYKTIITNVINAEETKNFIRGVSFFTEKITDFKIKAKKEIKTKAINYYNMAELNRMVAAIEEIGGETEIKFKIQMLTGARIGEICGLKVKDIEAGVINFVDQIGLLDVNTTMPLKTGEIRFTPIPTTLEAMIMDLIHSKQLGNDDFIFKRRSKAMNRIYLRDILIKAGVEIIDKRSTHGFRRSLTTFVKGSMLERGVISDSINFERYIGHKVDGVPEMYNKSYMEDVSKERFRLITEQYFKAIKNGADVFRIDYNDIERKIYGKNDETEMPQMFVSKVLKLAQEYGINQ